jgi:hypothetical protein
MYKMTEFYLISVKLEDGGTGYVHFDPHKKAYVVGATKVGACGFRHQDALKLVLEANIQDYTLEKVDLTNVVRKTVKRGSKEEKDRYDNAIKDAK